MSDCVEWTGYLDRDGYGVYRFQGKMQYAHRVAFFEARGYWPNICRHTCDNPPCVNIDHLLDGTMADNMRDKVERGRAPSVLTWEKVHEMRSLYAAGNVSQQALADEYGVSQTSVSSVVRGITWKEGF